MPLRKSIKLVCSFDIRNITIIEVLNTINIFIILFHQFTKLEYAHSYYITLPFHGTSQFQIAISSIIFLFYFIDRLIRQTN